MSRHLRRIERMDTGRKNRVVPESAWPGGLVSAELHANVARFTTALAAMVQGIKRASDIDHALASERGGPVMAAHDRKVAERAWDACVRSMRYEDGTPVEIVTMTNPYRADAIEREVRDD